MKEIGMLISQLEGFSEPSLKLEQYETDGSAINFFLSKAFSDINGRSVVDLGAGTGFISFACALAGANFVLGVELDKKAVQIALKNLRDLKELGYTLSVNFVVSDIRYFSSRKKFDLCVMNPPFGIQKKFSDRLFLKKAFELADVVWTFLSVDSEPFVKAFCSENRFEVSKVFKTKIHVRKKFYFHKRKIDFIDVDLYRLQKIRT